MNKEIKYNGADDEGIDELFRKTIAGHRVEPDPGVWKGISRKLLWLEIKRFNFKNLSVKFRVTGILVAALTGIAIYLFLPGKSPSGRLFDKFVAPVIHNEMAPAPLTKPSSFNSSTTPAIDKGKISPKPLASLSNAINTDNLHRTSGKTEETTAAKAAKSERSIQSNALPLADAVVSDFSTAHIQGNSPISVMNNMAEEISFLEPIRVLQLQNLPGADTVTTIMTIKGAEKFVVKKSPARQMFSASIGINPELAFYRGNDTYTKMNYWVNGGVSWHISRFSISSGIGLGYMLDYGKYRADYKSRDSIGYFDNVVSFTAGSNNEIVYNTKPVTIYDSLQHNADYRTSNRYTYLRIPLLFGYRVFESNRVSVSIQTGPAISFLLGSMKSDPVIEYSNARIIRIDDETPARLKTNWQLWANLYLEIHVTKKISLYLEPSFKYFMKPTAEQENSGANPPWSLGLGIGLQFNFEPKNQNP
ncbi:MAG: outer membrane beta-barrel protein [Bacteroidetes bacterium]|nr:outer membrane beta-barrel protein [Bacteroidota bacterium]